MILEEKDGLRILTPKSNRYLIHMKSSNTYHDIIYLPKNATLEDFEDIEKTKIEGIDCTDILLEEQIEISNEQDRLIIELATEIAILKLER